MTESTFRIKPELEGFAVPVGEVKPLPGNAVQHDMEDLKQSLIEHGQYRPIIVNKRTGHIVKGNGTYAASLALGAERIAVAWIDVDEKDERRKALVDNRASELGWMNDAMLVEVLADLPDLDGTGYDTGFVDWLTDSLAEPLDLLPAAPADKGKSEMDDARERFENAAMRQLVLVVMPAEYDQLMADLDSLSLEGENIVACVARLVTQAAQAKAGKE